MESNRQSLNSTIQPFTEQELEAIYQEMDMHNYMHETNINGRKVTIVGSNYASPLVDIDKFVHKVLATKNLAFDIEQTKAGQFTVKALHLAKYYKFILAYQSCYSKIYWYSEHVELFFKCVKILGLWGYPLGKPNQITTGTGKPDAQHFNDLITLIREQSKIPEFLFKLHRRIKNSQGNNLSAKDYVNALFEKHSKLLVVRVNAGYQTDFRKSITLKQVQKHIRRFLNNWRNNKLFENCVGYIWKIEMGDMKGLHTHFALFFNGNLLDNDEYIGQQICDYWDYVITKGEGICDNSNRHKKEYELRNCHIGIGMIEHHDLIKRNYLLENIEYMTKTIQFIKLKNSPKTRTFGRGSMPKIPETPLGRPRNKLSSIDEPSKDSPSRLDGSTIENQPIGNTDTSNLEQINHNRDYLFQEILFPSGANY
jgi:hypothetical protein